MKRITLVPVAFLLFVVHVRAQSGYTVTGKLVDTLAKTPSAYLTVSLLNDRDSIVNSSLSSAEGLFSFTHVPGGDYRLQVRGIGYRDTSIALKNLQRDRDLGTIRLAASSQTLKAVQVTSTKPVVRQEADRVAYDLDADAESKSISLLDMMRKVPYLSVDANDQVLLKGSSSYRIFINGKPSGLIESNPTAVLRSMPASSVKSIEVITNPPAKYDAEGLAGIINIITRTQSAAGYSGSINLNEKTPVGGPGAGANLSLKTGKFGISALFGGSHDNQPVATSDLYRLSRNDQFTEADRNQGHANTCYAGMEISYEADSLHLVDAQVSWNDSHLHNAASQQAELLPGTGPEQAYMLNSRRSQNKTSVDAGLNYQIGFAARKDELLTFSYRYFHTNGSYSGNQDTSGLLNTLILPFRQVNNETLTEQTVQTDYVRPLGKVTMEAGLKGIFRGNDSQSDYLQANNAGAFEPLRAFSDAFSNRQNVYAAYNSYAWQSRDWQVNGGVRLEETHMSSVSQGSPVASVQDYFTVAPSLAIRRALNSTDGLSLSYIRRIQRPSIAQLNPFVDRSDPQVELSGNPALQPTTTNIVQLAWFSSRKATWNVALGYMFFNSVIGQVTNYNDSTQVSRTSYENTGSGRVLKMNIYVNYPLTSAWSVALNADLRQVSFNAPVDGVIFNRHGAMVYVNLSSGYRLGSGWRLSADLSGNTSGISGPQSSSNGYTTTSFSLSKAMLSNRLNLTLRVSNPWQKFRELNELLTGPDFSQQMDSRVYFRTFSLSLNYRFGKLKTEIPKNKHGIKNDDLQ